jgi:hypothetical protein
MKRGKDFLTWLGVIITLLAFAIAMVSLFAPRQTTEFVMKFYNIETPLPLVITVERPVIVTATPDPSAQVTSSEMPQPADIAVSIDTATPSPQPTSTPEPTPFTVMEEFETGDFSQWDRVIGTPTLVNGRLIGPNETRWELGDETWQNYVIEYRFGNMGCEGLPNYIGVRVQDDTNMLIYRFGGCFGNWYVMRNGDTGNRISAANGARGGTIRIRVVDDRIQLYRANNLVFDYVNTSGYDTGGIIFFHSAGPVEWMRIEKLD